MRAEQHGRSAFRRDPADVLEHLSLPGWIEAERRLVEEDDSRVVDERTSDAEPLPHAAAVGPDQRASSLVKPHLVEELARDRAGTGPRVSVETSVKGQVLLTGLTFRIAGALGQHPDAAPDLGGARV